MIRHFVALGDSFTEGVGDPDPRAGEPAGAQGLVSRQDPPAPVPLRSATDWLALWMGAANPGMRYTNLAERGLRAGEIRDRQMGRALSLRPDFVSLVAGANDCLRGPFSAEGLRAELGLMLGAFESTGAKMFTATLPDFTLHLQAPDGFRARLGRNLQTANAVIRELAQRHGAILFDFRAAGLDARAELWSRDGVHPNALGYLGAARAVAAVLSARGLDMEVPR